MIDTSETPDWEEKLKIADKYTETADYEYKRVVPVGRPARDRYPGKYKDIYFRVDVLDWLTEQTLIEGNGASVSVLVNRIIREEIKRKNDERSNDTQR